MQLPNPIYGLGLPQSINLLVDYNPLWPLAYEEEALRIREALGDRVLAIEHYGSTSIPGMPSKPIIDIQVGVADIAEGLTFIQPMAPLGYDYAGDQGIPEHHIFGRGRDRTHLVHVVKYAGEQWFRSLHFRDRLRSSSDLRREYLALKRALADGAATRSDYTAGKAEFVERVCKTK